MLHYVTLRYIMLHYVTLCYICSCQCMSHSVTHASVAWMISSKFKSGLRLNSSAISSGILKSHVTSTNKTSPNLEAYAENIDLAK